MFQSKNGNSLCNDHVKFCSTAQLSWLRRQKLSNKGSIVVAHWSAEYLLGAEIGFLILALMTIKLVSNESLVFSEYENTFFHTLL